MTDIAKCSGINCELRESCYRFLATGDEYQTYINPDVKGLGCVHYWSVNTDPLDDD